MRPGSCWGLREARCWSTDLGGQAGVVSREPVGYRGVWLKAGGLGGGGGVLSLFNGAPLSLSETGDIYIWGWNESGQLALPARSLAEDGKTITGDGEGPIAFFFFFNLFY